MQFGSTQFATIEFAGAIQIPAAAVVTWDPSMAAKPLVYEEIVDL
jgi:hypothetical protein